MRLNHLCQRFHLRHAQRPLTLPVLREQDADMRNQAVERQCEFTDLVGAVNLHLHGEVIAAAHASHCRCERMQRPPEMTAQAVGKIRRHAERNRIHHQNQTKEIVQRCRVQTLSQMHDKARIGRGIRIVAKHGLYRRCIRLRQQRRGKALAVMIEHIHHHIVIAIRQDDLPLVAVLHTLNEWYKSLAPHINDDKSEEFIPLPNRTHDRKNRLPAIRLIAVCRYEYPSLLLYSASKQPPVEIAGQTVVTRQIVRRNNLCAVCGEKVNRRLPRTTRENRIEITVDMLHIAACTTQKCEGLRTHEQRVHQPLITLNKVVDLS